MPRARAASSRSAPGVAGVSGMLAGRQPGSGEHVMHGLCHGGIRHGRRGGGHVRDQVRRCCPRGRQPADSGRIARGRVLGRAGAGLGEVDFVSPPALAAFLRIPRVQVVRGGDPGSAGREARLQACLPPFRRPVPAAGVLLDPDLAQHLHRGQVPQPPRGAWRPGRLQQVVAVGAVLAGQVLAFRLARGQPPPVDPLPVNLLPGRADHPGQPPRRRRGQGLQRGPDRFPGQLQPVQVPDPAQRMRRISPLRPPARTCGCRKPRPGHATRRYSLIVPPTGACLRRWCCSTGSGVVSAVLRRAGSGGAGAGCGRSRTGAGSTAGGAGSG
jgi:hypothetical protein